MKKIICVVDNAVKRSSRFWGEHGLSFWIDSGEKVVLFDSGQSGSVLIHNLDDLGLHSQEVVALTLSHAHYDHSGGLESIFADNPGLPLYANPDLFRPRFSLQDGDYVDIGMPYNRQQLTQLTDLHLSAEPLEVIPGLWTSGVITERNEQEGRSPHHFVPAGEGWQPDPYRDDMSMVIEAEEGLILVCGCCHAGLLNTMAHVRRVFQRPITVVMGGSHLVSADDDYLQHVIDVLREDYHPIRFYLNHCTGERAIIALSNAFGELVQPFPVGSQLVFD